MIVEGERYPGGATVAQAVEVLGDRWQADRDESDLEQFYSDVCYAVLKKAYLEQKAEVATWQSRAAACETHCLQLQERVTVLEEALMDVANTANTYQMCEPGDEVCQDCKLLAHLEGMARRPLVVAAAANRDEAGGTQ